MTSVPSNFARRRRRGFTLIEVLAALMLLAIALPVVMQGITLASSAGSLAKRRTEAGGLAESKLNELVATNAWQSNSLSGDFGPDWPDYTWTAELLTWSQGQGLGTQGSNTVQQLDVHVLWRSGIGQQSVTVSTLVYQSASSTSGTSSGSTGGAK